jgi:hypothetical protein
VGVGVGIGVGVITVGVDVVVGVGWVETVDEVDVVDAAELLLVGYVKTRPICPV